jgi:hypothetical protein
MAKTYDAAFKHLIDAFADDWGVFLCRHLGLPEGCRVEPMEADLSTVSPQADKLFHVVGPVDEYIHLELESSWAGDIADRMLIYNVLATSRYGRPVRSIVILLRREANAAGLTGELIRVDAQDREYLRFRYDLIRLWEMPAEPFFTGPIGILPLGLLTDQAQTQLVQQLEKVNNRVQVEASPTQSPDVLKTCILLLGLRYDKQELAHLLKGVRGMKESAGYQFIEDLGRAAESKESIREIGQERFGPLPNEIDSRLDKIEDLARLRRIHKRLLKAADWNDLLATP